MTVSNLLQEARALVEQGWCQGEYQLHGSYCIVGALKEAQVRLHAPGEIAEMALGALTGALPTSRGLVARAFPPWTRLIPFNDSPKMTRRRVLNLFDRALTDVTK